MKIVFVTGFSSPHKSYRPKDEEEFDDGMAIRLIAANIAKPLNKEEYEELVAQQAEQKAKEEESQVKAYALVKQDELKESATLLKEQLDGTLELIDDDEFKRGFVGADGSDEILEDIKNMTSKDLKAKYLKKEEN